MANENIPATTRRWDDPPGVLEFRVLTLERRAEDQEVRLRVLESGVTKMNGTIDDVAKDVKELKDDAHGANTAAWRTFWVVLGGVILIIISTLAEHFVK